ncbi:MAG: lactate utilization protein [Flavobacteriaceae bacterium]|nr:lactate utilization protein [Flavobacteriaceae bacterium]
MNFLKRLFGITESKDTGKPNKDPDLSKFTPEQKLPIDEMFTKNFTKNGGKFLYCEDENELQQSYQEILKENDWIEDEVYCYSKSLQKRFKIADSMIENSKNATCFISTCEYLIANTGALLVTSNQIGEKKLNELPYNFIILATTSQLLETIGEGLQLIKQKNKKRIPSNITTLKNFKVEKNGQEDFMTYGSPCKNLYLLLLEDL